MFDLTEGFFSGDDDCWIDPEGNVHELDRASRQTHRQLAVKLIPDIPEGENANKIACSRGWIRVWAEGKICFVELDFQHAARRAVTAASKVIDNMIAVVKVGIEDSASMAYEEFDDLRLAMRRLRSFSLRHDMARMFECEEPCVPTMRNLIDASKGPSPF